MGWGTDYRGQDPGSRVYLSKHTELYDNLTMELNKWMADSVIHRIFRSSPFTNIPVHTK
jgi:hypothetical protein